MENIERIRCLIIGSGPAGYTAAIYAARADLKPVIYQGTQPGGQLTTTTEVENFPGYPDGVQGPEMMEDMRKQAARFETDIRYGTVTKTDFSVRPFVITIDEDKIIHADAVIIATGATAKYLGLESEEKYKGSGVSACATCDGFFYKGHDVAVVGGGDTACEEADYLSKLCKKVYLIHRRDELRASKSMQTRVLENKNIEVLFSVNTKEVVGDMAGVNGVLLQDAKTGEDKKIDVTGVFIAIGHKPNSDVFVPQIETDGEGYIITKGKGTATNISGVFAAGDIQDSVYRQGVAAAGSGCMAAIDAERWLSEQGL